MISFMSLPTLCSLIREQHLHVAVHSNKVHAGAVFVVMPAAVPEERTSETPGGERFLAEALQAAPGYVVCEARHRALLESLAPGHTPFVAVLVEDIRAALGDIAQAAFGTDRHCPKLIGITGTNGKTTETYLLEALFAALGRKVGVIGTVAYRWPGFHQDAPLTTPDCLTLTA